MQKLKYYGSVILFFIVVGALGFGTSYVQRPHNVVIGVNLALSGEEKAYGEATARGIGMACDKINAEGGLLDEAVTVVAVDNHGSAGDAEAAVKQLTSRHAVAMIGPNLSHCALAVVRDATAAKMPVISPAGTNPDITVDHGRGEAHEYMFRATFIDSYQGRAMADYAFGQLKARTAAVVYDERQAYSKGLAAFFKQSFLADGGQVPVYVDISSDESFAAAVAALQASPCQVVYAPLYDEKAMEFIVKARDAGIAALILGPDGWNGRRMAQSLSPAYLQNLFYTDHYANDASEPVAEEFAEAYYEKYGELPDSYAALGYDSFMMVAEAVRRSGSADPEKIAEELAKTIDYHGVTGMIALDANHDAIKPVFIMTFWQGQPALLEKRPTVQL